MAKNKKASEKRFAFVTRKSADILLSSTPNSEWQSAKPDSVLDVTYPANISDMEKERIKSKLQDHSRVYLKEGPAEAISTHNRPPLSLWTYMLILVVSLALLACFGLGVLYLLAAVLSTVVANPVNAADQLFVFLNSTNSSIVVIEDVLNRTRGLFPPATRFQH